MSLADEQVPPSLPGGAPEAATPAPSTWRRWRLKLRRGVQGFQRLRGEMRTPRERLVGMIDHLFIDHAVFRYVYLNLHEVAPGVERSAQPSPRHIRAAAQRGVKAIINLRGPRDCASYLMEQRLCAALGIQLVDCVLTSRAAPTREQVEALDAVFARFEGQRILMHCKSGADRAGIASALYLLLRQNRPVEEALGQLSLRYGHIRQAKTGVLDHFLRCYQRDNAREPMPFRQWLAERYDRDAVMASFRSSKVADMITDGVLERE